MNISPSQAITLWNRLCEINGLLTPILFKREYTSGNQTLEKSDAHDFLLEWAKAIYKSREEGT